MLRIYAPSCNLRVMFLMFLMFLRRVLSFDLDDELFIVVAVSIA